MPTTAQDIDQTTINTIRTLAMDAVQAANSGHPGTPMALAPVAYQLWTQHLRYDPAAPFWPNRDRYILSCGHASMLLYSLIHLAGIRRVDEHGKVTDKPALTVDDLRNFRQWGSLTPGHPEYRHTTGVETTTGPLGQGCGNSVGMAIAGRWLAARFNKPGFKLFDYNIWTQCSDGDLMEGITNEAASLAGHLKLPNLCWIYDDNHITIEGQTRTGLQRGRGDALPRPGLARAGRAGRQRSGSPGARLSGLPVAQRQSDDDHRQERDRLRRTDQGRHLEGARRSARRGGDRQDQRILRLARRRQVSRAARSRPSGSPPRSASAANKRAKPGRNCGPITRRSIPELAAELKQMWAHELPAGWDSELPTFPASEKGEATRNAGGKALNAVAKNIPWLLGGSADLAPSTKTLLTFDEAGGGLEADNPGGRNLHFGIREHGMAAAVNGMVLSNLRAFGATFFVFSDYCRPSLRLAAIMKIPSIFVFTHDSIGVGEDGPTHQPIEQLAACRAIPNLMMLRPGDANETSMAWKLILQQKTRPVAIALTRQNMPTLDRTKYASADGVLRGGYVVADAKGGKPDVILLATGSELQLAVAAHEELTAAGIASRVVSMPAFEVFDEQPQKYREEVLPPGVMARVAVEAGIRQGWDKYIGAGGGFIGLDTFGASAPYKQVYEHRGLTAAAVVAQAKQQLGR